LSVALSVDAPQNFRASPAIRDHTVSPNTGE